MGRLYNKEAVIELLLSKDRSQAPAWIRHLERLKDVVELELAVNPAHNSADKLSAVYQCPITGLEMNGRVKFVFSFTTGKVVSERAVKILQKDPAEADHYREADLVLLNPEGDEMIAEQERKMTLRRAVLKAERKAAKAAKKVKDKEEVATFKLPSVPGGVSSVQSLTEDEPLAKKLRSDEAKVGRGGFKDQGRGKKSEKAEEASEARKVFNPFAEQARKEKEEDALPVREGPKVGRADCKAKLDRRSVQESAGSQVFKKLFTSHESAQNPPRAHWTTFDPRYN